MTTETNDIREKNEEALKALKRARRNYRAAQTPETKSALRTAVVAWVRIHAEYSTLDCQM